MAASPNDNTNGSVRLTIKCDGTEQTKLGVSSVVVVFALNKIAYAQLIIIDGDMPTGTFNVSDADTWKPGASIIINAGYGGDSAEIFSGIIVRHGIKIGDDNTSRLIIECRDTVTKMTIGRNNANYIDKKDSDIISSLISAHGLTPDVQATTVQLGELVQYYCSDWDFMLARAELNGLLVNAAAGTVSVKPPAVDGSAVLSVEWGKDLFSFHADMDARVQLSAAQATSWDAKNQSIVQSSSETPKALNSQGNLKGTDLASVASPATFVLQTTAPQPKELLDGWAKAVQQKAGLARIRGRMSFIGSALPVPGCLIEVKGVGARFSGNVFVSTVEHQVRDGTWMTDVEFGLNPQWHMAREDVMSPDTGGLLPGIRGLQIGVVLKLDGDPDGEQRIQIKLPVMQATTEGVWARLAQFHASKTFGAFFLPEVGDEVIVGYLNDDPSSPLVLGSLYSSARTPPYTIAADNDTKAIVTRCQHKLEFDDKDKIITITTPGNNKVVISDKDKSILIQDQNNNSIKLSSSGIALDSASDITVTAKGGITLTANNAININAKADVKVTGLNVNCEAQVGFVGKGSASAELSAAGQTTVKGAMVMIN